MIVQFSLISAFLGFVIGACLVSILRDRHGRKVARQLIDARSDVARLHNQLTDARTTNSNVVKLLTESRALNDRLVCEQNKRMRKMLTDLVADRRKDGAA